MKERSDVVINEVYNVGDPKKDTYRWREREMESYEERKKGRERERERGKGYFLLGLKPLAQWFQMLKKRECYDNRNRSN